MKYFLFLVTSAISLVSQAQQLQLHYDIRHTLDPDRTRTNYPSITYEYFKGSDSTGSFLLKMQADLNGERSNIGQIFLQVSKNLRYWKPKVELALTYTGGLGVAPPVYGYYINNSVGVGAAYPFAWRNTWFSTSLVYRYNAFAKPSHDAQFTFYFGRGFFNYRIWIAGSFVAWTENRNQGTDLTQDQRGKKVAFFGDPQCWVKVGESVSVGSRINVYYHTLTNENRLQIYPTLGLKNQF